MMSKTVSQIGKTGRSQTANFKALILVFYFLVKAFNGFSAQAITYNLAVGFQDERVFKVTMTIPSGRLENDSIYRFVAYAPGVHQKMDFGRLVRHLEAYDHSGERLSIQRIGTNDWKIDNPGRLKKLVYEIKNTFDLPLGENLVHPQAGTGINESYSIINPHAVFGYFERLINIPIYLNLEYPAEWKIGTSLTISEEGTLLADSYRDLLDSPILAGRLSEAKVTVGGMHVEAFVYSPNDSLDAKRVIESCKPALESAYQFIGFAPVSRYVLLIYFHSEDDMQKMPSLNFWGALEHGYSSTYSIPAKTALLPYLKDMIAHEFLHILSPLNLHSDKLATIDYSKPWIEDNHLWLYEGVTEWATHIMQLKSGDKSLDDYLSSLSSMIRRSRRFENPYSLLRISNEWHTNEGNKQYGNIYQLGALTATILDIRLLNHSRGKYGLREIYLDFITRYGKDTPFNNDTFFAEFVKVTYPEIGTFIKNHIESYTPFNYAAEFDKIGISYTPVLIADRKMPSLGFTIGNNDETYIVDKVLCPDTVKVKVKVGDQILSTHFNNRNSVDINEFLNLISDAKVEDRYQLWIVRDGSKIQVSGTIVPQARYDVFEKIENISPMQAKLLAKWSSP